ncbi:Armadillo-like helical [Senna tora]|uniref:Armadillo-like helical n=1 Tax=Senna tora TaxID=362788 RepID=A0A834WA69_9FABA|nr:Armadillo-like helical [Senna tora]
MKDTTEVANKVVYSLRNTKRGHSLLSFLSYLVSAHSVSRIARSIESEIHKWIDESLFAMTMRRRNL